MNTDLPRAPKRILVIDDDSIDAFIHEEVLRQHVPTAEIVTYMDSRSALDRIRVDHANIDLILMDINMPVLSGWDLIESMREADIHTPVLMVSSSNHPSDLSRVDASELIQAFIPKPLTIEKMETYLSDS